MGRAPSDDELVEWYEGDGSTTTTRPCSGGASTTSCASCAAPTAARGTNRRSPSARMLVDERRRDPGQRARHDLHGDLPPPGSAGTGVDYSTPYPVVTVELEEQAGLRFTSTVVGAAERRHRDRRAGDARLARPRRACRSPCSASRPERPHDLLTQSGQGPRRDRRTPRPLASRRDGGEVSAASLALDACVAVLRDTGLDARPTSTASSARPRPRPPCSRRSASPRSPGSPTRRSRS